MFEYQSPESVNLLKKLLLFLLPCASLWSPGQNCEWIRSVDQVSDFLVHADDSGNVVTTGIIQANTSIGGISLTGTGGQNAYLAKRRPDGTLIWVTQSVPTSTSGQISCLLDNITSDDYCNYYLTGSARGSHDFGNGVQINQATSQLCRFLIKFDSTGTALWVRQIWSSGSGPGVMAVVVDTSNQPIVSLHFNANLYMNGTTNTLTATGGSASSNDLALIKYSAGGAFIYARKYGGSGQQTTYRSLGIDKQNFIYVSAINFDVWTFAGKVLYNGHIILKFNSDGDPVNAGLYWGSSGGGTQISAFPDGRVVVTGYFSGTLYLDSNLILIKSGNPTYSSNTFIAMFDTALKPLWAIKEYPMQNSMTSFPQPAVIRNDNIYFGGSVYGDSTVFAGVTIPGYSAGRQTAILAKLDTLGNLLWCFYAGCPTCSQTIRDGTVDPAGDMYFVGSWSDTLSVFNRQEFDTSGTPHGYTTKISDYEIKRGNVSSGPYCAGDSIWIPYTLSGQYESNNEFIAELSDSAGNFYQGVRELGRLQSDSAGSIVGILPLFQVSTSANYRIRIVSTHPVVQSYYLKDTLRLLIFSKDSADAGPDQTICLGETVLLTTTGGSQWQWSPGDPAVNPEDTARNPILVAPDTSTEFRICISDSSGCGVSDTDYVTVIVRPPLEIKLPVQVKSCPLRPAKIIPQVSGGKQEQYHYTWYWENEKNKVLSTDSVFLVSPLSLRRYWVRFGDSCSESLDSAVVAVKPDRGVKLYPLPDTTLCAGDSALIQVFYDACDSSAIRITWDQGLGDGWSKWISAGQSTSYHVTATDTVDGTFDTLSFFIQVIQSPLLQLPEDSQACEGKSLTLEAQSGNYTGEVSYRWEYDDGSGWQYLDTLAVIQSLPDLIADYRLMAYNECPAHSDTAVISIETLDPLEVKSLEDTLVCYGENILLEARAGGGRPENYQFEWYDENGTRIDTGTRIHINPEQNSSYLVVLNDQCSLTPDSARINVEVRKPLALDPVKDTLLCHGSVWNYLPGISGGWPDGFQCYLYKVSTGQSDSGMSFIIPASDAPATYVITAVDHCSGNTPVDTFETRPLPKLELSIEGPDSLCKGETIQLTAQPVGGLSSQYQVQWFRNDTLILSNGLLLNNLPIASGTYKAVLDDACSDAVESTRFITVLPSPVARIAWTDSSGCPPFPLELHDLSQNHSPELSRWHIEGNGMAIDTPRAWLSLPGYYTVSLVVSNDLGCLDSQEISRKIMVFPAPKAGFVTNPEIGETGKLIRVSSTAVGAKFWEWKIDNQPGFSSTDGSIELGFDDSGYYQITQIVRNEYQCADTLSNWLMVYYSPVCVIPNAFTPDNNGLNEDFAPHCSGVNNYHLTIYNRWGELILECDNCAWDGTYQGQPVPMEMYHYRIDLNGMSGQRTYAVGFVRVIR